MPRCAPKPRKRSDQYAYARRLRDRLLALVAPDGRCHLCGKKKRLEFDHVAPRTWKASDYTWHRRLKLYEREITEGKVAAACRSCNARKGPVYDESAWDLF